MTIRLDINYFRRRVAEKEQEMAAAEEIGNTAGAEEARRDLESCRQFLAKFEPQEKETIMQTDTEQMLILLKAYAHDAKKQQQFKRQKKLLALTAEMEQLLHKIAEVKAEQ
ncbi:hypothetical protein [Eikenella corrodens]|uniref:hypothetical protein n=1 Tax=Eikenella corrodens TaxID=539 RepID=UPI00129A2679|nr:hypothetical protein [Eikenella corrodens]